MTNSMLVKSASFITSETVNGRSGQASQSSGMYRSTAVRSETGFANEKTSLSKKISHSFPRAVLSHIDNPPIHFLNHL